MPASGPTSARPAAARAAGRTGPPRSLADQLRSWPDTDLVDLLRARPDLAVPLPPDLTSLATRAASRASVQRAMDALDSPALQVVEVLAVLPEPCPLGEVGRRWGAPAGSVLDRLRALSLVWGTPRSLRLVRAARDLAGVHPAGLGPPLAEALGRRSPQRLTDLLTDLGLADAGDPETALDRLADHLGEPEVLAGLLADAPPGVQTVLDRLTWGPPVGQVAQADRAVRTASATGPVEWLLARGLLAVADPGHVLLPREIGLALRGGRVHRTPDLTPPEPVLTNRGERIVATTAAGAAAEFVRTVEALGDLWGAVPPPVLRSGGLGVRELRRTAHQLQVDDEAAAVVVEVAYLTGLVAEDGGADPHWAPTPAFDVWRSEGVGYRWADLVAAWLASTRSPGLVGSRDARDAVRSALGPDLDRAGAPEVRRFVLDTLAAAAPDAVQAASVQALLDWTAPRRAGRGRATLLEWALAEAAQLGLTGAGALAPHALALLRSGDDEAAALLDATLPSPVDHVLLQADLTAVAPGPLEPTAARDLALVADIESRGGATVYRFTPASVRRALDAGRTGDDILELLTRLSSTPVPQPLAYLVQDVARRHGRVRIGSAQAYLRADDESALSELLADRRAAALRLRRLAPTVLAAQAPAATVLEVLRGMGLAPAAESVDGDVVLRRPDEVRTPARSRPRPVRPLPPAPAAAALLSAVQALRAADEAADERATAAQETDLGPGPPLAPMDPAGVLAIVRDATARRTPLWIGVVDAGGRSSRHLVEPLSVEAGRVQAFDRGTQAVRTFSVQRVVAVAPVLPVAGQDAPAGGRST